MDSKYILGCEKVDAHHSVLIGLLEDLHTKLGTQNIYQADLTLAKNSLEKYAALHFAFEEQLMASANYVDLVQHKRQHDSFLPRISIMPDCADEDIRAQALDLVVALNSWLIRHIGTEDRRMIAWVKEYHPELL